MRRRNHPPTMNESFSSIQIPRHEARNYNHALQQLTEELNDSESKNQQYSKLISILTEERNFYQEEHRRSQEEKSLLEEALAKYRVQMDSKNLLISELKKANRMMEQEITDLRENLDQSRFMFQAQEQQVERVLKQKQLIEAEWNRVIKDVNTKMVKLSRKQLAEQKENQEIYANLPLKQRVQKALRKIDNEIRSSEESFSSIDTSELPPKFSHTSTINGYSDLSI